MRQSMIRTAVLVVCAVWAVAEDAATQPACVQQPRAAVEAADFAAKVKQADTNQDGQVTFEEASAAFPQVTREEFAQYDRNGDGIVTSADAPAGAPGNPRGAHGNKAERGALLAKADADGNKQVTYEELVAVAPKMTQERFNGLDRNGDGVLTPADKPAHPKRGPAGAPQTGAKNRGELERKALFEKADADHNGQVTLEEFQAAAPGAPRERFDKMDRNHDGVLSAADRPAKVSGDTPPQTAAQGAARSAPQAGRGEKLAKLQEADVNKDRQVTFEELQTVAPNFTRERFDKLDRNHDGALTPEDRLAGGGSTGRSGASAGAGAGLAEKIRQADANGDGKTTYDEVTAAKPGVPREAFDRLDTNKDGVLSREDAPAAP